MKPLIILSVCLLLIAPAFAGKAPHCKNVPASKYLEFDSNNFVCFDCNLTLHHDPYKTLRCFKKNMKKYVEVMLDNTCDGQRQRVMEALNNGRGYDRSFCIDEYDVSTDFWNLPNDAESIEMTIRQYYNWTKSDLKINPF